MSTTEMKFQIYFVSQSIQANKDKEYLFMCLNGKKNYLRYWKLAFYHIGVWTNSCWNFNKPESAEHFKEVKALNKENVEAKFFMVILKMNVWTLKV